MRENARRVRNTGSSGGKPPAVTFSGHPSRFDIGPHPMDQDLLRTADRNLRRKYAGATETGPDIAGLTTFADSLASKVQSTAVTITQSTFDGGGHSSQITMPREVWLAAAEELLADPMFNPAAPGRAPRLITPDFRRSTPV